MRQPLFVFLVERTDFIRVHVEDRDQFTGGIEHWKHDLRPRSTVARNVSRELSHVVNPHRAKFRRSGAAHTPAERDLETAQRSLIRADTHEFSSLDYAIESRPQETEGVVDERADSRHFGDLVMYTVEHDIDVPGKLPVSFLPGYRSQIQRDFGHAGKASDLT